MNVYNFIFCYFYIFWNKRGNDGKFEGVLHVILALLLHFLLLIQIIDLFFEVDLMSFFPNTGVSGANKTMYLIMVIPFYFIVNKYYNKQKEKFLLKDFNFRYKNTKVVNIIKILSLIILPIVLNIILINLNN